MATKPRNYRPGVPVMCTQRFGEGVRWLDSPTLRALLIRLVILAAAQSNVAVLAFFIASNHIHILLAQDRWGAGHRTEGIAPFMRNVFAVFCRVVVMRHREQRGGHVVQRRYHHQELASAAELMRALAYVHGQPEHHGIEHLEDLLSRTSWDAAVGRDPDGVVTKVLEHGLDEEQLEALLVGTIERACAAERDAQPLAWRTALEEAGVDLVARGVLTDQQRSELCGASRLPKAVEWGDVASVAHARRRQARLDAGVIGPHFLLMQNLDDDGCVVSVTAYRGRQAAQRGRRGGNEGVEVVIDYRARPDPTSPPQDS